MFYANSDEEPPAHCVLSDHDEYRLLLQKQDSKKKISDLFQYSGASIKVRENKPQRSLNSERMSTTTPK